MNNQLDTEEKLFYFVTNNYPQFIPKKIKILIEVKSKNSSSSSDKPKIKKRKGIYIDTSNL